MPQHSVEQVKDGIGKAMAFVALGLAVITGAVICAVLWF